MAIISFNKIKEVVNKNKETHLIDLGKIDKKLSGIVIPIKVMSFEDTLKLKSNFKLKKDNMKVEWKPFTRLPKALKDIIIQQDDYRPNVTEKTYYQTIILDDSKIENTKFRERLFNVVIHIDMDSKTEEDKTLWEDSNIVKGDYNALLDLFSGIIQYEQHLDMLEIIINSIRSGACEEKDLDMAIQIYALKKQLDTLSEEERKEFFSNLDKWREAMNKTSNSDEASSNNE